MSQINIGITILIVLITVHGFMCLHMFSLLGDQLDTMERWLKEKEKDRKP